MGSVPAYVPAQPVSPQSSHRRQSQTWSVLNPPLSPQLHLLDSIPPGLCSFLQGVGAPTALSIAVSFRKGLIGPGAEAPRRGGQTKSKNTGEESQDTLTHTYVSLLI